MVLLLLGILTTIGVTQFVDFGDEARDATTREKLNSLKVAITGDARFAAAGKHTKPGYETHCVGLPASLDDLGTIPGAGTCSNAYDPFTKRGWRGPYVDTTDANWKKDAWEIDIVYSAAGRTVTSCGPDKTCGNADDIVVGF